MNILRNLFRRKSKSGTSSTNQRLYVLINKDLDSVYGCVQGGHVVAEWMMQHWQTKHNNDWNEDFPEWDWNNEYLIYLSVDIDKWKEQLWRFDPSKYKWIWFEEPDLGNKTTAIAIYEKDFPSSIIKQLNKEQLLK